ncbi:sensor domain-containing diguanylate cyclase [Vibrio galatheae]|uniref:sensor domain-containing diguanylate cyclase n=1 Tax=Vibrio galatheae TaxID=579748 RepID=UPI000698E147|nr:diguanylate cyclase [Vibrio galatheae]
MPEAEYKQEIQLGNSITLIGLGIFFGLFFYYFVLSITRLSWVDLSYAAFILGNLIFNATSLLVIPRLLDIHWYGGASWPILLSNIAYLLFVMKLLGIQRSQDRWVWWLGTALIALFSGFLLLSFFFIHYQNEFNRSAVGMFLLFGVIAGSYKVWRGNIVARWYLLANFGFVLFGTVAISQEQVADLKTIYMAHFGLIAVVCEVLMLSCVIAYQMTRLQQEKVLALRQAEAHLKIAQTDVLTQLPNRYAMEEALQQVTGRDVFIYIDLDGLKRCNDNFGHEMGDNLLISFGKKLDALLPKNSRLFRISGDEFGVIAPSRSKNKVTKALQKLDQELKHEFLPNVGVSYGVARFDELASSHSVVRKADERMFVSKRAKHQAVNSV